MVLQKCPENKYKKTHNFANKQILRELGMSNDTSKHLSPIRIKVAPNPQLNGIVTTKEQLRSFLIAITLAHDQSTVDLKIFVPRPRAISDISLERREMSAVIERVVCHSMTSASTSAVLRADVDEPIIVAGMRVYQLYTHHVRL